jgi:DNA-directed RNA polymerase subunit N
LIIPIRCFTCGKVIANKWEEFKKRIAAGESSNDILDSLGFTRYCCRRMLISHVELIDELLLYHINSKEEINNKWINHQNKIKK